jgi:hypothetical protein
MPDKSVLLALIGVVQPPALSSTYAPLEKPLPLMLNHWAVGIPIHPETASTEIDVIVGPLATAGTNVATTDLFRSIVTVSGFALPLASPDHPENKYPELGVAERFT